MSIQGEKVAATELVGGGQTALHSHAGGEGLAFPVGSVFLAVVATNPATLLGYGTWAQVAQGQFLVGQKASDPDFDVAEEIGGAKTHTLAVSEIPAHTHVQTLPSVQTGNFACGTKDSSSGGTGGSPTTIADALSTASVGGGGAHNNLPPYFVIYIWKRTA